MLEWLANLLEVSTTVVAIVLALAALHITTQAFALVDLARRDTVRGPKKWVWALVIVLGNLPGAIGYLISGRTPREAEVPRARAASAAGSEAARRVVDALYGPRDR